MDDEVVRIQFEMTREKAADLNRLMRLTAIRSRRELFDHALTFFDWGVSESMRGHLVAAIDEGNGLYQPVLMPAFATARKFPGSQSGKLKRPRPRRPGARAARR